MQKFFPKISIVTPSHKKASYIEDAINSVLTQKYPNIEYLIFDTGADNSIDIINKYKDQLHFIRSEPDNGQYSAISEGFSKSTGSILFWLNADDKLLPGSLWAIAEIFLKFPDIEWVSSLLPGLWDAQGALSGLMNYPGFSKSAFLDGLNIPPTNSRGFWIQQESTFFSRRLWEKAGKALTSCQLAGDFALWAEFYSHADLVGISYPLGGFRSVSGQRSEDIVQYTREAQTALESLRSRSSWRKPRDIDLAYGRLSKMPKIGNMIKNNRRYCGPRVDRSSALKEERDWTFSYNRFLP